MSRKKEREAPEFNPKYFEYEPEEVSAEETFETMAVCGMAPELIDDATEREAYIKFLNARNADAE